MKFCYGPICKPTGSFFPTFKIVEWHFCQRGSPGTMSSVCKRSLVQDYSYFEFSCATRGLSKAGVFNYSWALGRAASCFQQPSSFMQRAACSPSGWTPEGPWVTPSRKDHLGEQGPHRLYLTLQGSGERGQSSTSPFF